MTSGLGWADWPTLAGSTSGSSNRSSKVVEGASDSLLRIRCTRSEVSGTCEQETRKPSATAARQTAERKSDFMRMGE